ncbi:MAG: LPD38 domain-containing protein, partial [Phycisphaerae bacterium]
GARGLGRGEVDQIVRRLRESAAKGGRDLNTEITKIITETRTDVVHTVESTDLSDLPPTIIEIFRPSYRVPANLPVIRVMRHGLPRLYSLNADLYRAVAGLDRGEIGDLVKLLSAPARVLRAGAVTGLEFGVRNPVRDQFDAFMLSKYGYVPGYDLIRGLSALGVFKGKTGETETSRLMRIGGVGGAVLVALDRRYLGQDLSRLQARPSKWANVRRLANPVRAARVLSETMELATRAAEFKRALEVEGRGKEGILRATMAARRVTTDYGVMGANGVIRGLAMLTPFMNARIQHTDRLIQAFREEPRRTTIRAVLGATLPSMLLYAANHDDPRYQQLDWYERDLFFTIIPRPISRADWDRLTLEQQRIKSQETIWKIPKGLLGLLFGSSVERMLDYMRGQDPKAFTEWARSFLSEVNPLDVPAFARGVLGAYYDYDSFFNRPIDPPGRVGLDPSERYWPWTSELAKSLGGALGVSPAKLDFLWISQTGGLGRLGLDAVDFAFRTARRALPGAEVPIKARRTLADVPGLRAFVIRWPKQRTRAVREFYELRNQAAQRYHTWRNIKDKAARARYAQQHRFLIGVAPPLEKTARQISDGAGDARDLVQGTPQLSPEQKRNALDSIALQVNEAARRALEHARALRERLSQPTRLSQPLEAGSPGIGGRTEPPRSIPRNAQPLRAAP